MRLPEAPDQPPDRDLQRGGGTVDLHIVNVD
jgi:hypothetical protein